MLQTGRREEVGSDLREAECLQQAARRFVLRVMTGKERRVSERVEGESDDGGRRLAPVTGALETAAEVKADLEERVLRLERFEAAAAGEFAALLQKQRPVLNAVRGIIGDLQLQPRRQLCRVVRSRRGNA